MITPKNKRNTAYTPLPTELLTAIKNNFKEDFEKHGNKGSFFTFGRVYQGEIILRIGYVKKNSLMQINFDTSIQTINSKLSVIESLESLVFSTKELFIDYFKNNNLEHFSYHWNLINEKSNVFYKFHSTNTELELQANILLGEEKTPSSKENLIIGDLSSDSDEIEKIVKTLENSEFAFK